MCNMSNEASRSSTVVNPGSESLALRCKCANGTIHHISDVEPGSTTVEQLLGRIAQIANIQKAGNVRIKQGFPPKTLDTSNLGSMVSSLPIQNGDILIVEEVVSVDLGLPNVKVISSTAAAVTAPAAQKRPPAGISDSGRIRGMLLRRVVPADNSCLFTSINFAMNDAAMEEDCVHTMRQLIAATVMSDPGTYTAAMLGKPNQKYCEWILDPESWGGAIEIAILSRHYEFEICVVDMLSGCIQRFGEDQRYSSRIFLIYDGIHYDPLMLEPFVDGRAIQTKFSTDDHVVLQQAIEIGDEGRMSKQVTDTANFTLKCLVCGVHMTGEGGAQEHAKTTGHSNFGQLH